MKSESSTSRFWQLLIVVLAVLAYAAAMIAFGRRAGLSEFVGDLLSGPSVSKWFIAYSLIYFTGAVLLALSIRPRVKASLGIRRGLCICGVLALALGGFAVYAVFDTITIFPSMVAASVYFSFGGATAKEARVNTGCRQESSTAPPTKSERHKYLFIKLSCDR